MRLTPLALALCASATPAFAADENAPILVVGQQQAATIERAPNTSVNVTAQAIAEKVNAMSVEETLKYVPSLVIRKRNIGDNFAPIATRTSGLGSSARSLIYADGALLSALIANNNGNGSPRWSLVTPGEIERIDVLYGPFSAAYSGNAIGGVVNITTRNPEKLEARVSVTSHLQSYRQYGTDLTLPSWQTSASIGDRFGAISLFASLTRTTANSQPISYITAATAPSGAYDDVSKTNVPIKVLGAGGIEHHVQDTAKFKATWDVTPNIRARYVLGVWRDDTQGAVESYIGTYTTAFNSALYTRDALHFSHVGDVTGHSDGIDWQVIGTRYRYARDWQNSPSPDSSSAVAANGFISTRNDLPNAFNGGAGVVTRQDGTGWDTLDARLAMASGISIGAHFDHEVLNSATSSMANWLDAASALGQVRSASHGNTRTYALWAQDEWRIAPRIKLTLGGRQEWWRAWNGYNMTYSASVNGAVLPQPERDFAGFSPKASVEWGFAPQFVARLSAGQAFRMPTVGELYQTVATGTLLANPNPNLSPERARSVELALEHKARRGNLRISFLNEVIANALISQTGPLATGGTATYVQNVDETRGRVVEIAADRREIFGKFDLQASATFADVQTVKDAVFPSAIGKTLPGVPRVKANAVLTFHPAGQISLSAAARYASRYWANLDNADTVGNTYQGFYRYFVVDLRAQFRVNDHFEFALGVDNVNNDNYFLFHPFPQRSYSASAQWRM
jgi:iron complex outermembrane receptor protein